jgi:hypothetical protein
MRIGNLIRWALAIAFVILSAMNASWVAPQPPGVLKLIATTAGAEDGCITTADAQKAFVEGADYVIAPSKAAEKCLLDARQMPKRKFMLHQSGEYRATQPTVWNWTLDRATECYDAYFKMGWLGVVPEACRGKTMLIPLDGQWKLWGWPKRFMARMNAADVKVILGGPSERAESVVDTYGAHGLTTVTQIPEVPRDFTGYLLLDDIAAIGPAIRR